MSDDSYDTVTLMTMIEAAAEAYVKSGGNDDALTDSIPDFIPFLFKAGYNAGFEAARHRTTLQRRLAPATFSLERGGFRVDRSGAATARIVATLAALKPHHHCPRGGRRRKQ